jgi:putative membrane protein
MMTGFGMGFGVIGLLLMVLLWGGLIFLAVWLATSLFGNHRQPNQPTPEQGPSAKEILDQRYARGEITREQYEQMKHDLN